MEQHRTLDSIVRNRLKNWPNRPAGFACVAGDAWLRGRPDDVAGGQCFLKLPGSTRLKTLPDGLWLNFGGSPAEPWADIFAIEACATLTNLLDKRSRFAPSTQSLMAVCPVAWLAQPVAAGSEVQRWRATGVLAELPLVPLVLPVRSFRVMYGLRERHYQGFQQHQLPHAHEFFVPMEALMAKDGDQAPAMKALMARVAPAANFLDKDAA